MTRQGAGDLVVEEELAHMWDKERLESGVAYSGPQGQGGGWTDMPREWHPLRFFVREDGRQHPTILFWLFLVPVSHHRHWRAAT